MRWITEYIDENNKKWAREKLERQTNEQQWLKDWAKMSRLDKIQRIREEQVTSGKKLTVSIKSQVLTTLPTPVITQQPPIISGKPTSQPGHCQSVAVCSPARSSPRVWQSNIPTLYTPVWPLPECDSPTTPPACSPARTKTNLANAKVW